MGNDKVKKVSFVNRIINKVLRYFRLNNEPVIKVYHGYSNGKNITVYGHALALSSLPRKTFRKRVVTNFFSMLRLFIVKPLPGAKLKMNFKDSEYFTSSEIDGFYKFEIETTELVKPGKHEVFVTLLQDETFKEVKATGIIFVPDEYKYAVISDVDDTFLISHSSNLRKRLYVLLTKNAHSRKPFEGVIQHYKMLANAGVKTGYKNPFFYVSSSEWNLFDFLNDFAKKHELPEGVFLLSQLKKIGEVFKTGQGKHSAKYMRIVRIVEAFPNQQLILLGDDSQMDPSIYLSMVEHFPGKISCVYLRQTNVAIKDTVKKIVEKIIVGGTPCCYFRDSAEAMKHSEKLGLVQLV
ncbi:MAG: phosphatase domain-containing protein [Ginsengibacter sp.]